MGPKAHDLTLMNPDQPMQIRRCQQGQKFFKTAAGRDLAQRTGRRFRTLNELTAAILDAMPVDWAEQFKVYVLIPASSLNGYGYDTPPRRTSRTATRSSSGSEMSRVAAGRSI
jgi:hypothetical protein